MGADRIRVHARKSTFQTIIVPTDGTITATVGNGDFGTSPFFAQLSGEPSLPSYLHGVPSVKHNKGLRINNLMHVTRCKGRDISLCFPWEHGRIDPRAMGDDEIAQKSSG